MALRSIATPELLATRIKGWPSSIRCRTWSSMITSLTTIAGLLPLMLETSLQAQILIPIAVSISFGLMASTVLVLLLLPPLYVILSDFGLTTQSQAD